MGYLQEIGAWTQREVERRRETRPFAGALHEPGRVKVIAEIKRASPSEGPIAPNADAAEVARRYEAGGAAAISVLTSGKDFAGSLLDLAKVRQVTDLPLLCKDFFIDPYQVVEARAHGADAILVLLALVDDNLAKDLIQAAEDHQMDVLCEVHNASDGKPHPTNTRAACVKASKKYAKHEMIFGIEQEYTFLKLNGMPLGFPE
ncbi:MAG: hypothetical protein WCN97_12235, partial [Thermoleophilia bacterium]